MPEKDELRARRHCMVVFAYYPAGETRVQREAEALVRSGFEVDVLCLHSPRNGTPPAAVVNGVRVHRLPIARKYRGGGLFRQFLEYLAFFFAVMFALIRLQRCRRYDVVQVHNLPDFLIFAAWFPRLLGARLILDLHDLMPEFAAALSGRKGLQR